MPFAQVSQTHLGECDLMAKLDPNKVISMMTVACWSKNENVMSNLQVSEC